MEPNGANNPQQPRPYEAPTWMTAHGAPGWNGLLVPAEVIRLRGELAFARAEAERTVAENRRLKQELYIREDREKRDAAWIMNTKNQMRSLKAENHGLKTKIMVSHFEKSFDFQGSRRVLTNVPTITTFGGARSSLWRCSRETDIKAPWALEFTERGWPHGNMFHVDTTTAKEDNSQFQKVLDVLLNVIAEHNYMSLRDSMNLQFTCRSAREAINSDYFYFRTLRDVLHIPFCISPSVGSYECLRRWTTKQFVWTHLPDNTTVWLSRAVDPNPIGCHDKPVYAFGGQTVQENRYSNTLFKIVLNGLHLQKEIIDAPTGYHEGPCGRAACGVAMVLGKIFVFGGRGWGWYLDDVWCWSPDSGMWTGVTWKKDQKAPAKRWAHSMVSYGSGFLVYGGSAPGVLYDDLWSFTPDLGWQEIICEGPVPPPRAGHASLMHGGYFYISGGNTAGPVVETYCDFWRVPLLCHGGNHPVPGGRWEKVKFKGPKLTARIGHSIVPLSKDRIMLFGGRDLSYGLSDTERFSACADVVDMDAFTNTSIPLPPWLQRTGVCALNHPEGIVFWGGLSPDRMTIAPAVLCRPI